MTHVLCGIVWNNINKIILHIYFKYASSMTPLPHLESLTLPTPPFNLLHPPPPSSPKKNSVGGGSQSSTFEQSSNIL